MYKPTKAEVIRLTNTDPKTICDWEEYWEDSQVVMKDYLKALKVVKAVRGFETCHELVDYMNQAEVVEKALHRFDEEEDA